MNNWIEYVPAEDDCLMTIQEWEESCEDGLFIDYDGFGYLVNMDTKTELVGLDIYPSMRGERQYESIKGEYTHINWFNR